LRAPFISFADFVNRRLVLDDAFAPSAELETDLTKTGLSGTIQAAIDDEELLLNAHLADFGNAVVSDSDKGYRNHNPTHRFTGAPDALTQGDILTRIGSTLSARGDTFVVRAFGEKKSKSGQSQASAWCEAVVQRTNRYMESTDSFNDPEKDPPERTVANLVSDVNKKFGRRFEIIGFRWLNEGDL